MSIVERLANLERGGQTYPSVSFLQEHPLGLREMGSDDLYVFRVASLRNVAMTAPYFHDGSVATLPEAVRVMARVQLGVTLGDAETNDIVAFLESLTGELPANFATVPTLPPASVTPPRESSKE